MKQRTMGNKTKHPQSKHGTLYRNSTLYPISARPMVFGRNFFLSENTSMLLRV